ncbi:MAG: hypothetical protein HXS44_14290 [Theionarchaea archaeon]|nr:hypothetical protein [Theionarchaea archaeon]
MISGMSRKKVFPDSKKRELEVAKMNSTEKNVNEKPDYIYGIECSRRIPQGRLEK